MFSLIPILATLADAGFDEDYLLKNLMPLQESLFEKTPENVIEIEEPTEKKEECYQGRSDRGVWAGVTPPNEHKRYNSGKLTKCSDRK